MNKKIVLSIVALVALLILISMVGCRSSQRAAYNLDIEAEEFRLTRRIAAVNGITDKPLFEIVGQCSIETGSSYAEGTMEIVCKTGEHQFTKDFIYLSDNVVVEQIDGANVPQYHYQMVFAPQSLIPIPEIVGGRLGE